MTTEERFKPLEGVMVEALRKQDCTVADIARMRAGQDILNNKVVRAENRLKNVSRDVLELRRDTEKHPQKTTGPAANHRLDLRPEASNLQHNTFLAYRIF